MANQDLKIQKFVNLLIIKIYKIIRKEVCWNWLRIFKELLVGK
jgi:hypothetical protein